MEEQRRKKRNEEEILETGLAAVAAALFVSSLKKILIYTDIRWLMNLLVAPSPLLFLLLHLIIASIVIISTTQPSQSQSVRHRKRKAARRKKTASVKIEDKRSDRYDQEEEGGDAEEVNARAEAFIMAFRHQLRVDSFGLSGCSEAYSCS